MTAYVLQKSAPFTVDYGKSLSFSGADLPGPTRISVPTRDGRVGCDLYRPQDDGETPHRPTCICTEGIHRALRALRLSPVGA